MTLVLQPWPLLLTILAGLVNHQQREIIEYLRAENRVLKADREGAVLFRVVRSEAPFGGRRSGCRSCTNLSRMPAMSCHGTSGFCCRSCRGSRLMASPTICSSRMTASWKSRLSMNLDSSTPWRCRAIISGASRTCSTQAVSAAGSPGFIQHPKITDNVRTQEWTKRSLGQKIDLPATKGAQFALKPHDGDQALGPPEAYKNINVVVGCCCSAGKRAEDSHHGGIIGLTCIHQPRCVDSLSSHGNLASIQVKLSSHRSWPAAGRAATGMQPSGDLSSEPGSDDSPGAIAAVPIGGQQRSSTCGVAALPAAWIAVPGGSSEARMVSSGRWIVCMMGG